jgi:hypothetical protein
MTQDEFENAIRRVQYLGISGDPDSCLMAIDAILNSGVLPKRAIILSLQYPRTNDRQDHLFIFEDWGHFPLTIIPSGFASGYPGQGPRSFSLAICLLREKGIPIYGCYVQDRVFKAVDKNQIEFSDDTLFKQIRLESKEYSWPWPMWVNERYEQMLERGLLWQECYWRYPKTNQFTDSISEIEIQYPTVGKKLRLAKKDLDEFKNKEELQQIGILIRDAWIEFSNAFCIELKIDTTDVPTDNVIQKLKKLPIEDELLDSCRASLNLSLKVQHDRKIKEDVVSLCLYSSAFSMYSLLCRFSNDDSKSA